MQSKTVDFAVTKQSNHLFYKVQRFRAVFEVGDCFPNVQTCGDVHVVRHVVFLFHNLTFKLEWDNFLTLKVSTFATVLRHQQIQLLKAM